MDLFEIEIWLNCANEETQTESLLRLNYEPSRAPAQIHGNRHGNLFVSVEEDLSLVVIAPYSNTAAELTSVPLAAFTNQVTTSTRPTEQLDLVLCHNSVLS